MSRIATTGDIYSREREQLPFGVVSQDPRILVTRNQRGVALQLSGIDSIRRSFKVWTRRKPESDPATYQWTVCMTRPTGDDVPSSVDIAGWVIMPDGNEFEVSAPAWTDITVDIDLWIKISVDTAAIVVTFETTPQIVNIKAKPAILVYALAAINADGKYNEDLVGTIDLTGAVIPAWYAGYSTTANQAFRHLSGADPSWVTYEECDN